MKIGIIVAMDKEFAQLQTLATDKNKESHAHYDFVTGRIGDNEVIMMQCGIGKVNAAIGADQLISWSIMSCLIGSACRYKYKP